MPPTDEKDIPQVQDKRPKITGLLPKNTQGLVLGGIALLMILVILFSGHNAPKEKPAPTTLINTVTDPSQTRIQDYRARIEEQTRKLAAEEAALAQTKAALGSHMESAAPAPPTLPSPAYGAGYVGYGAPAPGGQESEKDWIERDRQKREYQALFASNIALSHRREIETTPSSVALPSAAPKEAASASATEPSNKPQQYRLFEGTILETVLTNRLDSSFSGPVDCMVTTNVYSHDGLKLLIPQGSRVLGEVRKLESFGEQRVAVSFHRLIMPDGFSVSLDQFKALDQIGETGLLDQVNHHYLQIFGVSIALGALAGLSQSNTRYSLDESATDAYRQGVAGSVSQSAMHVLDRYLNVLPTFTIREGYRIKVYLSQDLMLPSYDQHPVRQDL